MRVFISHAKEDNSVVIRIITILDENGVPKWVDLEQLEDVDSAINESINEGLSTSDYFLLVWSKHANESNYVKKEYNAAITPDYDPRLKKIIIRLDDTLLPPLLADKKYHSVTEDELDVVLEGIIAKIKKAEKFSAEPNVYDEYLDSNYGKAKIVEYEYDSSLAFKRVDPKKYQEDLEDWEESTNE